MATATKKDLQQFDVVLTLSKEEAQTLLDVTHKIGGSWAADVGLSYVMHKRFRRGKHLPLVVGTMENVYGLTTSLHGHGGR
jgi:hypothetical protein